MVDARRDARNAARRAAGGLLACAVVAAYAACGDATGPPPSALPPLVVHVVRPSATDAAIAKWDADHYAWVDTAARPGLGRLFVFLPGTNGAPSNTRQLAAEAARLGYHVVGLMYADDIAVLSACAGDPDAGCMEAVRAEITTGADRSPHVAVDAPNSIDNRLLKLLEHLHAEYPAEGWGAYVDGGLAWERIAVGGLSQGGGHAAYIATLREVARVVMFGAPADGVGGRPGPWVASGATPADRHYGLAHARDPFASIRPNWLALGMGAFGPVVTVEQSAPPFGGSHMLTTDLEPALGGYANAHPSVVADVVTPLRRDGSPALAPAWRYLLGGAR